MHAIKFGGCGRPLNDLRMNLLFYSSFFSSRKLLEGPTTPVKISIKMFFWDTLLSVYARCHAVLPPRRWS